MGFLEVLTIIFVLLKVFGVITWSWWLVLLPAIIAVVLYAVIVTFKLAFFNRVSKDVLKDFDGFDD